MVIREDSVDGPGCPQKTTTDCSDDEQEEMLIYRAEIYRLQSFQNWHSQSIVRKEDLAKNGFYYLGERDRVRCVFCNVVLSCWENGDNVAAEHQRHSKYCPFVLGKMTSNIPYSPSQDSLSDMQPASPEFQDYDKRLASYEKFWPKAMKQRPRELAAAGLFYTEKGDAVKCFHCGGLLRNWDPQDKPWEEHARWFPRCLFIRENNLMSPVRGPLHREVRKTRVRKVSLGYDEELVKMFELDRRHRGLPECEDEDMFVTEIEKFKVQQDTQPPSRSSDPPVTEVEWNYNNEAASNSNEPMGYDEVDVGRQICVSCNMTDSKDSLTLHPCQCSCCVKCLPDIDQCPSCKMKVKAAAKSSINSQEQLG
ncbi:baculoviral IAP repeat-containing protein 7-B-like isoform X2 [Ostrea edulis]|uniref:baculoviral IAP repeat-containing protein 7-B-like isoform X2 n=1 Tax=Ostrea edulis TaxID=37623 RepID=UPI0024AED838|nr:baculoviral IAP repeat-containing protein 7-B-like isoform X2 [Ostrea edulis]